MPIKNSSQRAEQMIKALNYLVTNPHTVAAAGAVGVSRITLWNWSAKSSRDEAAGLEDESEFYFEWMEQRSWYHRHQVLARKLAIMNLDAKLLDAAVNNHHEKLFRQGGEPVWVVDPKLAADAQDPLVWEIMHAPRPITDIFKRGPDNELIQATIEKPSNPQLLIKAVSSHLPEIYGEKVQHTVQVGGVLRLSAPAQQQQQNDFARLTSMSDEAALATNVLAASERAASVEQFDATFGGKRLIEAVLFFEGETLLPPLAHVIIVFGSSIHREYAKHGIAVKTVDATELIAQGYRNNFLFNLVPNAKRPDYDAIKAADEQVA